MSETTRDTEVETAQIIRISDELWPLFQALPATIQGGVLASLLAKWVFGHEVVGDSAETLRLQDHVMRAHFRLIHRLLIAAQAAEGEDGEDDPANDDEPPPEAA